MLPGRMVAALFASILIATLGSGCAVSIKHKPGKNRSVSHVLQNPNVWVPLMAAAVLQVDDLDEELSDALREDKPLFGSTRNAVESSDNFRDLTEVGYLGTAMMTPGSTSTGGWIGDKGVLLAGQSLIIQMGQVATSEIKTATGRERPNSRDTKSFVSGHTSAASSQSQMAVLNVENLQITEGYKQTLNLTFNGLAALTGWARVEAGEHYPSDVLAGWALGYLTSNIGGEFIGQDRMQIQVRPQTRPDSSGIEVIFNF